MKGGIYNIIYVLWPLTVMSTLIIMLVLKMQLSPATIDAPGQGLWRP